MRRSLAAAALAGAATALAGFALAGPERVTFPKAYDRSFVRYLVVERPDRKIVRNMYVTPEAHAKAVAGEPIPDGAILVMEDMKVRLNASGNPERDPEGRFIPTGEVIGIFVMEKRKGWGETYPPEKRNGDWEYSSFAPDGTVRPNLNTDGCFTCHLSRKDERDFTFTYAKVLMDQARK